MGRKKKYEVISVSLGSVGDPRRTKYNTLLKLHQKINHNAGPTDVVGALLNEKDVTGSYETILAAELRKELTLMRMHAKRLNQIKELGKEMGLDSFWWEKHTERL